MNLLGVSKIVIAPMLYCYYYLQESDLFFSSLKAICAIRYKAGSLFSGFIF